MQSTKGVRTCSITSIIDLNSSTDARNFSKAGGGGGPETCGKLIGMNSRKTKCMHLEKLIVSDRSKKMKIAALNVKGLCAPKK
mmetsp:Transcript_27806/g.49099  ORF Transcript_27806/g.49099 Transcript_27806/m.49099 type:complete len:83 (+) Transcript_27806:764-1012(+)